MMRRFVLHAAWLLPLAIVVVVGCLPQSPTDPGQQVLIVEPAAPSSEAIERHVKLHKFMSERALRYAQVMREGPKNLGNLFSPPAPGEPVPIPGGLAPGLHVWLPGPVEFGFQGVGVEPSTITNFKGFSAIGFLAGVATGSDGNTYEMFHDMRVFSGEFVDADGNKHRGTFAFI